jgi:hypothetical protein
MLPPHVTSVNRHAVAWATAHAAESLTDLPETVRDAIRALIIRTFTEGMTPRRLVAELMPWVHLGLADQAALQIYQAELLDEGYTGERFEKSWQRYQQRCLKACAKRIARREVQQAFHQGQLMGWREAIRRGLVDPARTWRVWLAVLGDDRSCEL